MGFWVTSFISKPHKKSTAYFYNSYKCFAFNLPGSFFLPINLRYNLYVYFKLVKNTTRKERKSYEEISRIIARNGFNTCLMCLRFSAGTANRTCKAGGCRIRSTAGTTWIRRTESRIFRKNGHCQWLYVRWHGLPCRRCCQPYHSRQLWRRKSVYQSDGLSLFPRLLRSGRAWCRDYFCRVGQRSACQWEDWCNRWIPCIVASGNQ